MKQGSCHVERRSYASGCTIREVACYLDVGLIAGVFTHQPDENTPSLPTGDRVRWLRIVRPSTLAPFP